MADLQTNIEHLSNKIQGSLVSHEGGTIMETNNDIGAFHYNTAMDSVAPSHAKGLPVGAQMIHQEYDTVSGQQVEANTLIGNDQSPNDLYDLSGDQRRITENNFAPNAMETMDQQMYQQQEEVGRNNEEYIANDPNMDAYMMEQEHNQYSDYPSQYQEGQYVNGDQFNVTTEQMDDNQTVSDVVRSNTETLH